MVRPRLLLLMLLSVATLLTADARAQDNGDPIQTGQTVEMRTPDEPPEPPAILDPLLSEDLKTNAMLGLAYWQWLGLFAALLAGFTIDLLVRIAMRIAVRRVFLRQKEEAKRETVLRTVRPIGLFAAAAWWVLILHEQVNMLALYGVVHIILLGAAQVFAVLAGTWAAWRLVDLVSEVLEHRVSKTATRIDDVLLPLVRKTLKIFILIIGVIYAAQSLDIPIGPMIASLGVGSLAFAFAAKDTIENFFGSVAVLVDRPFTVGDWVVLDDHEGIVEQVGFRSTRIRTFYNSLITVPNSNLVRAVIDNYGLRKYRRWKTNVSVQYDTTPDQLVAFTEGIRELIRTHPYTRKDYFHVYLNEFADSSLNILLYVFWQVPDWGTELRERERLFLDILRLADRLGVQFAFPTHTVHLYNEEPTEHEPRFEPPQSRTERRAAVNGIRTAQDLTAGQVWRQQPPPPVTFRAGPTELDEGDEDTQIENRTAGG